MIETRQLTKRYGDLIAVDHIDLKLEEGDVFGFIGPNGSGKTTTMRMLATLLNPDYGEAYVCGKSIYTHPQEIQRLVGYMPDFFGVYDDMSVIEYLEFFAAAYRIDGPARRKICEEKLELVDMSFKRDAMVNQLSRGQTQRIGLARVIVSSHILPELADVCTRVGMIEKGVLIVDGYVNEVMKKARESQMLEVRVTENSEQAAALLEQHDDVARVSMRGETIEVTLNQNVDDYSFLPQMMFEAGYRLTLFREEEVNLETAFMELTRGKQQ